MGVDVTVSGFAEGPDAAARHFVQCSFTEADRGQQHARRPRHSGRDEMLEFNKTGYFPVHAQHQLLYGLHEALDMISARADHVLHDTSGFARARVLLVNAWGWKIQCADPAVYSPVLTGVMMPEGVDADAVRKIIYERFDTPRHWARQGERQDVRIGHLGECNDVSLMGTICALSRWVPDAAVSRSRGAAMSAMSDGNELVGAVCRAPWPKLVAAGRPAVN